MRIEVLLNATTRRDEQGNVIGVVGIGQDITARLAQEREYSKLIDSANAPIFGVDTQGRVNVWNQCARKLVGYSTAEGKVNVVCVVDLFRFTSPAFWLTHFEFVDSHGLFACERVHYEGLPSISAGSP